MLTNSTLRNGWTAGLRILGTAPTLTGDTFKDNNGAAVSMDLAAHPAISNPTLSNNGLNGARIDSGTLPGDIAWDNAAMTYQLGGSVTVPTGTTLTIGAGQVVKLNNTNIVVSGTLKANGTAAQPIIITSFEDDTAGGDTNNNGASTGARGDW